MAGWVHIVNDLSYSQKSNMRLSILNAAILMWLIFPSVLSKAKVDEGCVLSSKA
jgi:hypothetical protein